MHNENLIAYNKQLSEFIEVNYSKLKKYAVHQMYNDEEAGSELFHDLIVVLYSGKRKPIDFTQSPLTYFQHLLRGLKANQHSCQQRVFDKSTSGLEDAAASTVSDIETYLDNCKRYQLYQQVESMLSEREVWLLCRMRRNKKPDEIFHEYVVKTGNTDLSRLSFRTNLSKLLKKVRLMVQAQAEADSSNDPALR